METTTIQQPTATNVMGGNLLDDIETGISAPIKKELPSEVKGRQDEEEAVAPEPKGKAGVHKNEKAPIAEQEEEDAEEISAEDKALLGIEDAAPTLWSDEDKAKFKAHFGSEDPDAFKNEFTKLREEHANFAKENVGLKATTDRLAKLDPHVARAMEMELDEKGSGQKYLKSLPDVDLLNKDAKKISDKALLNTYVPDHGITEEQWAILNDENADPDEAAALKRRIGFLRANGEDMHKKAQGALAEEREAEQARQREFSNKYNEAVAAAIAHAKNSPLKAFITAAHEDEIRTGKFVGRFVQEDGISPKPELLEILLKAEKYDTLKKLAEKNYNRGKGDGAHETMTGLPSAPKQGRSAPKATSTKTDPYVSTLDDIEKGIR